MSPHAADPPDPFSRRVHQAGSARAPRRHARERRLRHRARAPLRDPPRRGDDLPGLSPPRQRERGGSDRGRVRGRRDARGTRGGPQGTHTQRVGGSRAHPRPLGARGARGAGVCRRASSPDPRRRSRATARWSPALRSPRPSSGRSSCGATARSICARPGGGRRGDLVRGRRRHPDPHRDLGRATWSPATVSGTTSPGGAPTRLAYPSASCFFRSIQPRIAVWKWAGL